jgi:hypothetical protein
MTVTAAQAAQGLGLYMDRELLPSLPRDGWKGFGIGVAATLVCSRAQAMLEKYMQMPALQQMGLCTKDGGFDLDAVKAAALKSMPEEGLLVSTAIGIGIRIRKEDIEKLYRCIEEVSRR